MTRTGIKRLAALIVLLTIGLSATGCGGLQAYAAIVNGKRIDQSSVFRELQLRKKHENLLRSPGPISGLGENTYTAATSTNVLTSQIFLQLVKSAAAKLKVKPKPEDVARIRSSLGEAARALPAWYLNDEVARLALQNAIADSLVTTVSPDQATQYYEQNKATFVEYCLKGILINDKAKADDALAKLQAGQDFATLSSQLNEIPSLKQSGGDLGCAQASQLKEVSPDLPTAVAVAPAGGYVGPVKIAGPQGDAYIVLRVESIKQLPLDAVRVQINRALGGDPKALLSGFIDAAAKAAKVKVNPQFGLWVTQGQEGPRVDPLPAPRTNGEEAFKRPSSAQLPLQTPVSPPQGSAPGSQPQEPPGQPGAGDQQPGQAPGQAPAQQPPQAP